MKICIKCNQEKDLSEFSQAQYVKKDGTRSLNSECKECHSRYNSKKQHGTKRDNYLKYQKEYHSKRSPIDRIERLNRLDQLKNKPCGDCGHNFPPECMDFDHIDPSTKFKNVSNMVMCGYKWENIMVEIDKCRLICANCHRIRTAQQQRRSLLIR